ncbi:efflux transporter outer membrane subunit [Neisseria elongata]|nr:efflux transporter outer membrane subunit [Neisseria elongata]
MFKRFPLFFLCAALFSGCATHPKHPAAAVETAETLGLSTAPQPPIAPQWWRALNDAKLDGLIDTALARSPDLTAAQARLRQAQAGADLANAQRGVKIGLGLSGALLHRDGVNEREKPELISDLEKRLLGDHGTNITYESLQLQGQWSPDVFGKYKHQLEAALGQQRAVEYEIAQTRLLLAQGVATYYRQWQLLLETRQRVAQRAQLNREREQVVRELIRAGQLAPSKLYAVQQGNSRFQAALSDLDGNIAQVRHALAALTGQPAQALDTSTPNPATTTPAPPVSQLTADLLGKRPDLAAQREALTARRHLVASAKTEFYPNITIKALAGLSNVEIGNLPHSSSFLAGLLPSVSLPIFTSGTLRANLSRKEAEFDEQAARYNKNVYTALREAADALTQYETAAAAVRDQTEMTALARKNAAAAQSRYRAGLDNKLDWLAAQDETLQNEAQLAQAQAKLFTAWLALNTAFGGGFAADK